MSEPVAKRRPMIDLDEFERRLRQPSAASRGMEDDPLAELARLVGGQDDPYKTVFGAHGQPRTAEDQESAFSGEPDAGERLISGDFAAIEAGLLGAREHAEDRGTAASGVGDDDADHWGYDDAAPPGLAEAGADDVRSRRPLYLMAAIIIVGMAGIGASFGLKSGTTGQREIATIKASEGPAKIQPVPTGQDIPAQDASILDTSAQPAPVALTNNIEQPVDLSRPQEKAPRVIALDGSKPQPADSRVSGAASVPVPPPPVQPQAQVQAAPLTIAGLIEPKKVKTVSVRPDGTLVPNDQPPQGHVSDAPLPAPRPSAPAVKASTPKVVERVATTPKPAPEPGAVQQAQPAKAQPIQVADAQAGTVPDSTSQASAGTYAVQLAAPESEDEARAVQVKLMKKYASDLAGFRTSIRKAAIGDKTVYRVRVGGLTRDEANVLCQKVQSGGGNCFVARN